MIAQAVEAGRQAKQIGNALEGEVTLALSDEEFLSFLRGQEAELEEFFILSDLRLVAGSEVKAEIVRSAHRKCARCWRHRANVGVSVSHADLCGRCAEVVDAVLDN